MKKYILFFSLLTALLSAVIPCFAQEYLLWSNFNDDPVKDIPEHYPVFIRDDDRAPVLITRIRTYHWNDGKGAEPGQICIREGYTTNEIQCWQAVGRSFNGVQNVYWEVLTDFIMEPGHSYGFRVSDFDSWSNNEASDYFGMIELYGENPAPGVYYTSAPAYSVNSILPTLNVGQTFTMGQYEQDNNPDNGKEPIEWQVLTVRDDLALVISKYQLDELNYIEMTSRQSWELSLMREWLNGDFYNNAFDDTEKERIFRAKIPAVWNSETGIQEKNPTDDWVFLLSIEEAEEYFTSDQDRISDATAYLKDKVKQAYYPYTPLTEIETKSMLRSPAVNDSIRSVIKPDGKINSYAICSVRCDKEFYSLRPAFWLKIAALPTPTPEPRSCYKVTYTSNNCLAEVPVDNNCYQPGDTVTILFEPVEYMDDLTFYGWDINDDGDADFGYSFYTLYMPSGDVELKAICIPDNPDQNQYDGITTGEENPGYYDPQQYYNPNNDPTLNNDTNDPGTGWLYAPENNDGGVG